jgi:hypothetical protein
VQTFSWFLYPDYVDSFRPRGLNREEITNIKSQSMQSVKAAHGVDIAIVERKFFL